MYDPTWGRKVTSYKAGSITPLHIGWKKNKLSYISIYKAISLRIHVWYIYLDLFDLYGKCR